MIQKVIVWDEKEKKNVEKKIDCGSAGGIFGNWSAPTEVKLIYSSEGFYANKGIR